MEKEKDFNEWRAEKLGYVYFSRLTDLIINEPNLQGALFDYLIDIAEGHKQTGRLFGVEVKAFNNKILNESLKQKYRNIAFPALLVLFDNKTDHGYFKWIKKPDENGQLVFDSSKKDIEELNDHSLNQIVTEIKNWYMQKPAA